MFHREKARKCFCNVYERRYADLYVNPKAFVITTGKCSGCSPAVNLFCVLCNKFTLRLLELVISKNTVVYFANPCYTAYHPFQRFE